MTKNGPVIESYTQSPLVHCHLYFKNTPLFIFFTIVAYVKLMINKMQNT